MVQSAVKLRSITGAKSVSAYALTLAMSFACLQASAQPQTQPAKPKEVVPQAKKLESALALLEKVKMEDALAEKVSLSVTNASVEGVLETLHPLRKSQIPIKLRDPQDVQLSFAVEGKPVADILRSLATFSGCRLRVLRNQLILAPDEPFTATGGTKDGVVAEGGKATLIDWSTPRTSRQEARKLFTETVGEAIKNLPGSQGTVADLGSVEKTLLQQLLVWNAEKWNVAPTILHPGVELFYENKDGDEKFTVKVNSPTARTHGFGLTPLKISTAQPTPPQAKPE